MHSVSAAATHELSLDMAFLGVVTSEQEPSWTATLLLGNKHITFKLDTGAEVTAMSEDVYQSLGQGNLQRSSKALYGPACQTLRYLGNLLVSSNTRSRSHHK